MRQLTPSEVVFVGGETATIYQHTAGVILLDARDRPGFDFQSFRTHLEDRLGRVPHFRWRLHEVPFSLDLPYWVEDEDFDFDHHIRRIALPTPGDRRALGELVSYLYSRHLDRARPLWEAWFIEGLGDAQFACFTKLHHSMMDGEGAAKLGEVICDIEPDAPARELDPAIADARAGEVPEWWREALTTTGRLAGLPVRAGVAAVDGVRRAVTHRIATGGRAEQEPVPTAVFNRSIGRERGYVFGSVPLADVTAVKRHFGVTVNDVVLALVSGSLRDFLLERGDLPESSLRTSIAVSLRAVDDDDFSNRVTTAGVTLATKLSDPVERLRAIAGETASAKEEAHHGGKGFLELMSILPPALVHLALSVAPAELVPRTAGINLIVSSVRGSPIPLYLAGARVAAIHPMSIIMPGGGLNVTCMSYADEVSFGLTVDPTLFPEPWPLVDGLQDTLASYLALVPG